MKLEPIFKTKSLELYKDFLIYLKSRRLKKIVLYDDITNFTASYTKEQNFEQYTLNVYDGSWNYIKLGSFITNNDEIINFFQDSITPLALPKLLERFNDHEDLKLGLITVNKNKGIIKTNNVIRTIPWENIQRLDYQIHTSQFSQALIVFELNNKTEKFVFDFEAGNLKKHTFMIQIFEMMIGKNKVKCLESYLRN